MLEAQHLSKVYTPKKGVPVHALDDVSLKLPEKGMVFLLGKSGSGKSTLLNILGGLDRYDEGDIIIKGVSSKDFSQKHFDSYRNTYIGFIFQEYNILEEFSIGANIGLALELQGKKATSEQINDILRQVDLEGMGNRKPNELSGGQKQRVAIARALVKNPQIIMADEPTGALDSKTGKQVFDTLKKLSQEKLVLIVSHDREFSEQYADRIIELSDGKIISDVEYMEHEEGDRAISGLTFHESGIDISDDYVLTEEDTAAINEYLKKKHNGNKIRMGVFSHGRGQMGTFTPTDESKITTQDGQNFTLIKSRLPMKNALKMGANNLNHKKFRLVLTILLSLVAFALFGLADTMASYEKIEAATQSILDSHIQNATFTLGVRTTQYEDGEADYYYYNSATMNDDDIRTLTEKTGLSFSPVFDGTDGNTYNEGGVSLERYLKGYSSNSVYDARIYGFTSITEQTASQAGLSFVAGRMASGDNEIVLTQFLVDQFNKYGYQNQATDESLEKGSITAQSMIGKHLTFDSGFFSYGTPTTFTIVGVLETNFDYARYDMFMPKENEESNRPNEEEGLDIQAMILTTELENTLHYGYHTLGYVSQSAIADMAKYAHQGSQMMGTQVSGLNLYFTYDSPASGARDSAIQGSIDMGGGITYTPFYDSFWSIGSDADLANVAVGWLDGVPRTTLAQNEYVISAQLVRNMLGNSMVLDATALEAEMTTIFGNRWAQSAGQYSNLRDRIQNLVQNQTQEENAKKAFARWFGFDPDTLGDQKVSALYDNFVNSIHLSLEGEYSFLDLNFIYSMAPTFIDNYSQDDDEAALQSMNFYFSVLSSLTGKTVTQLLPSAQIIGADYSYRPSEGLGDKYFTNDCTIVGYFVGQEQGLVFNSALLTQCGQYSSHSWQVAPHTAGMWAFAIAPMPKDAASIKKLVALSYTEGFDVDLQFELQNQVMDTLGTFNDFIETGAEIFVYIGLALALFSALLLMNFISVSISYKRREIGILRAIGSRSADVFKIFFSEAFLIACINYVLSVAASLTTVYFLNDWMRSEGINVTLLNFGVRQFLLMFAISVAVAAIASFFPVYRIATKRPIDAIRNK